MGRQAKQTKQQRKLAALEQEFRVLLVASLRRCIATRGCFFLTEAEATRRGDLYPKLVWPETRVLVERATQIEQLRLDLSLSQPNPVVARFRQLCRPRGPNDLGDARLAEQFLQRIESGALDDEQYREMTNDTRREREAEEWSEGLLKEIPDE